MRPTKNQAVIAVLLVSTALIVCLFVWPTLYIVVRDKGYVFRVNRLTGVRESATDKGWMTQEQVDQEEKANAEKKAVDERNLSERILAELRDVQVEDGRDDFERLVIYNPTDWNVSGNRGSGNDTFVEYYLNRNGSEIFLCKEETANLSLKPHTHSDFRLRDRHLSKNLPAEIEALSAGTKVVQKITVRFAAATNDKTGVKYITLQPPFELSHRREFTVNDNYPKEVQASDEIRVPLDQLKKGRAHQ